MRTTTRALYVLLGCALIGISLGCSADSKHGIVTGSVTLDGQPLKIGNIRFEPTDGGTATADAPIADGKFTGKVPPGDKRVLITAPKVTGKKKMYDTPDSPVVDLVEELLPKRYNTQSELQLSVKAGKQEAPPFVLKSK
jgi:hypothetical protein